MTVKNIYLMPIKHINKEKTLIFMRRRVIQAGKASLSVSLPKKWVDEFSIKKGQELFVSQEGDTLAVTVESPDIHKKSSLPLEDTDRTSLISFIRQEYRSGADRIVLSFDNRQVYVTREEKYVDVVEVIEQEVKRLMGLEIVEETVGEIVLQCMVTEDKSKIDEFFRKSLALLPEAMQALIDATYEPQKLSRVLYAHDIQSRFISYATRLLNKFGSSGPLQRQEYRGLLESLELIMDIIESVAARLVRYSTKPSESILPLLKEFHGLFEQLSICLVVPSKKASLNLQLARIALEHRIDSYATDDALANQVLGQLSMSLLVVRSIVGLRMATSIRSAR